MQRYNLTAEQLFPYQNIIHFEQTQCLQMAKQQPATNTILMTSHGGSHKRHATHVVEQQQRVVIASNNDELNSTTSNNNEDGFLGFKSVMTACSSSSSFSSANNKVQRRHLYISAMDNSINLMRISEHQKYLLEATRKNRKSEDDANDYEDITPAKVRKPSVNDYTTKTHASDCLPEPLPPENYTKTTFHKLHHDNIFEINSNSTTSSQKKKREERNKWLKEQLYKQEKLRDLQTAKIREFRELLNQRSTNNKSNTNISTDSTISEFPASSPSNQHPLSNPNKYAARPPLLKNTLPADAFERTLAIISAANTQITYSDKVNQWQCASDLSEVEDVRDFDMQFKKTEICREQQRKARKRRYAMKSDNIQPTPMYTLEQFCDMLTRQCKKKYATTPFTAMEHLHRQSRLHKTAFENHKYACQERSESSESTLDGEVHCNRRNKRKPSATQRRIRRISSPTPEKELTSQSNSIALKNDKTVINNAVLLTTVPSTIPTSPQDEIESGAKDAVTETWKLNSEEKSLFRFYKHHFAEQETKKQVVQEEQQTIKEQPNLFKAPTTTPIVKLESDIMPPEISALNNTTEFKHSIEHAASTIKINNELPAQLLATASPSQSGSSENILSRPHSHTNNNIVNSDNNNLPITSSTESRRSLPADFGVIHQQQEFCSYLGLTGLGMPSTTPINRSNSALTRRSLRVRMQQKIQPSQQSIQPKSIKARSNQQSLDGSNFYMTPAYSQQSPMPSSEQQSEMINYLQSNVKRIERRQSLDYSNYTSESPKHSSQTQEEYGMPRISNFKEQLKHAYNGEEVSLLEVEKAAPPTVTTSNTNEVCGSKMLQPTKCTPIVQYKPNMKPEIKIICSLAATDKAEILRESTDAPEQPKGTIAEKEAPASLATCELNSVQVNGDINGNANAAIQYKTEPVVKPTLAACAIKPNTEANNEIQENPIKDNAADVKLNDSHNINNSRDSSDALLKSPLEVNQANELSKSFGKLPKLTPQDAYKCFQQYLLESRKNKPSICIVQTLPGANTTVAEPDITTSRLSFEAATKADTLPNLESNKSNMLAANTAATEAVKEIDKHATNLNTDSATTIKPAKPKKKSKPALIRAPRTKLVTRSSRRKLRHSNRSKIALFSAVTIKRPKRKTKPKVNSKASTSSRIVKTAVEQTNALSEPAKSAKLGKCKAAASKGPQRLTLHKDIKHVTADESEIPCEQQSTTQITAISNEQPVETMEWHERRRKTNETNCSHSAAPVESRLTTTTIRKHVGTDENICKLGSNTIITINPLILKPVPKTDSEVQTNHVETKEEAIQCAPDASNRIHYISAPSVMFENPLRQLMEHGPVIYMYYELDVLIVVQETLLSFWKYSKIANLLFHSPTRSVVQQASMTTAGQGSATKRNEWCLLSKIKRLTNDIEIQSPYANRICVHNSIPLYLELRCRQLPHGHRECKLLTVYVNVYYFHDEEIVAKVHSIPLDSVQAAPSKVLFTTLIDSRYFIMSWSHENSLGKVLTGFCKYSLTPHLDTLASIRGFKNLTHEINALECINEDKLIGFGRTQVTIWDHRSGDILMNYDLNSPLGINMGCTYYPSFDLDNMIVLYQYKNSIAEDNCELEIIALNISALAPSHRILHRHTLPANMVPDINNTINNGEQLIMTAQNDAEVWISCADPTTLTYVPAQQSRRFYARGRNQIIEITDESLNVLAFTDYLLKLKAEHN